MTYLRVLLYIQSLKMDLNSKIKHIPDTSIQSLLQGYYSVLKYTNGWQQQSTILACVKVLF